MNKNKGENKKMKKINEMMVVKGRHDIINNQGEKVENFVFDEIEDVRDVNAIQEIADKKIESVPSNRIHLYVTGLTVATIAVINAVIKHGKELVLWHYDREQSSYYPQKLEEYLGKW